VTPYESLAADLRGRSDEQLAVLLAARPDLLVPVPPDVETLALRALSRWSISAALTHIDLWCGELAQALVALRSPTTYAEIGRAMDADADDVARGLDRLRALGLVWGSPEAVIVAEPLDGMLSPSVARPGHPTPPSLPVTKVGGPVAARAAGDAAGTAVRLVEDLLDAWGALPPPVLKSGGLGVREQRRTATLLDVPPATVVLLAETAYTAGLLASSEDYDPAWLPTPAYDEWIAKPVDARWATLASAWLGTSRAPGLAAVRDERGKARAPLGPELEEPREPGQRRALLDVLAGLPAGVAAAPLDVATVVQWHRPVTFDPTLAVDTLAQAELLGVTGRGALAPAGRAILAGDESAAAAAVAPHLPPLLNSVLLQADLTAVAPGPLEPTLARDLRLLADVESTGGATVYRFTEGSLRRAFDAGRSADDVHRLLAERSRTPVPQPLRYLIDDIARRHGRIRVGTAEAFLRCDDEALLTEVLAHRRTASLRLRRLAPTVLTARAPAATVLEVLRGAGFAPAGESATGDIVIERVPARRAPTLPLPPQPGGWPPPARPELVAAAVRALRAGERAARHRPPPLDPDQPRSTDPMVTLRLLRTAAREGRAVWIGYLNAAGVSSQRIIEPRFVEGGYVTAYDHRRGERRTFAAHRITSAALVSEDDVSEDEM